ATALLRGCASSANTASISRGNLPGNQVDDVEFTARPPISGARCARQPSGSGPSSLTLAPAHNNHARSVDVQLPVGNRLRLMTAVGGLRHLPRRQPGHTECLPHGWTARRRVRGLPAISTPDY